MRYTIHSNDLTNFNGLIDRLHRTQFVTFIDPYSPTMYTMDLVACYDGYMIVDTNINMLHFQSLEVLKLVPYYCTDYCIYDINYLYNFKINVTTPKELCPSKSKEKSNPENRDVFPVISW